MEKTSETKSMAPPLRYRMTVEFHLDLTNNRWSIDVKSESNDGFYLITNTTNGPDLIFERMQEVVNNQLRYALNDAHRKYNQEKGR